MHAYQLDIPTTGSLYLDVHVSDLVSSGELQVEIPGSGDPLEREFKAVSYTGNKNTAINTNRIQLSLKEGNDFVEALNSITHGVRGFETFTLAVPGQVNRGSTETVEITNLPEATVTIQDVGFVSPHLFLGNPSSAVHALASETSQIAIPAGVAGRPAVVPLGDLDGDNR